MSDPRVFISYARKDGEGIANDLRQRMEQDHDLPVWQDLTKMEGGHGWWEQIREAIKAIEFLVLVMTPEALKSRVVRQEWRMARQEGTCVIPVKGAQDLAIESLPQWMKSIHFVDPERPEQWSQFIETLDAPCDARRVPFMAADLPDDYVARPNEFAPIIAVLRDAEREEAVAITTALEGAGGFGKTVLAQAVCHDDDIQESFYDGILWVTLGEKPGDLIGRVTNLIEALTGERPGFDTLPAATTKLVEVLQDRVALIVIDDVWNEAHLKPFIQGGPECARLITTRDRTTVPDDGEQILVDAMQTDEAKELLGKGLPEKDANGFEALVTRLGEWPLLVKLVNGVLRSRMMDAKQPVSQALAYVNQALDSKGLTYFDARNAEERWQAVDSTISVSLDLLTTVELAQFRELAVFPEDAEVPLRTVETLWSATSGLNAFESEELCRVLFERSLLLGFDLLTRKIRLHDVIRQYLLDTQVVDEMVLHQILIGAYEAKCQDGWASLPDDGYTYQYLPWHLVQAGRTNMLRDLLFDFAWMRRKLEVAGANALINDYDLLPDDTEVGRVRAMLLRSMHVLMDDCAQLSGQILGRLTATDGEGAERLRAAALKAAKRPVLLPSQPTLSRPGSGELQTFQPHQRVSAVALLNDGLRFVSGDWKSEVVLWNVDTGEKIRAFNSGLGNVVKVTSVTVLNDGRHALSGYINGTMTLWDLETGQEIRRFEGHERAIEAIVVLNDGRRALTGSGDKTLRLWNLETGQEIRRFEGHLDQVSSVAFLQDGCHALSGSTDGTLRLWNVNTGDEIRQLVGRSEVTSVAVLNDGRRALSGSLDGTVRLWDLETGEELRRFEGHTQSVTAVAHLNDGRHALSASEDGTLRLWNVNTGDEIRQFVGHTNVVTSVAVLNDGRRALSGSLDGTVRLWDLETRYDIRPSMHHSSYVLGLAIFNDGRRVLSGSGDKTLRLWNLETGQEIRRFEGHESTVEAVVVLNDGRRALTGSWDKTLRLWDLETGQEIRRFEGHSDRVHSVAVFQDGCHALSGSRDGTLRLWNVNTAQELQRYEYREYRGRSSPVNTVAIINDGRRVLSGSVDNMLRLWDLDTGQVIRKFGPHSDSVSSVAVLHDGCRALSASIDGTMRLWNVNTGDKIRVFEGHSGGVTSVLVFNDGCSVLSGSADNTLRLWDLETGKEEARLRFDASVEGLAASQNGLFIVVGDAGGGIHVIDILDTE